MAEKCGKRSVAKDTDAVELECADQEVLGGTNFSNKSQTVRKKKKFFNVCGCRSLQR